MTAERFGRPTAGFGYGFTLTAGSLPPWNDGQPREDTPGCHAYLGEPTGPEGLIVVRTTGVMGSTVHVILAAPSVILVSDPLAREVAGLGAPAGWDDALAGYLHGHELSSAIDTYTHPDRRPRWLLFLTTSTTR